MRMRNKRDFPKGEIVIYKTKDGQAKLEVNLREETVWLDAHQMAKLFGVDRTGIVRHIANVYKAGELDQKSTCAKIAQVAEDGKVRQMDTYNLDAIISVGYRVNSSRATQFRVWATKILKDYLLKGFVLNEKRLKEQRQIKLKELENAIALLQNAVRNRELKRGEAEGLLKIITDYANSWLLLQKYDEGKLRVQKKTSKISWELNYELAKKSIAELKGNLIKKKTAAEIFGQERGRGLEAIIGNLKQSFGGKKLYPSIEQRAAHLLYFVVKDHPFVDGNKRIASLLFIQFLVENNCLFRKNGERKINDNALVALALLVAESNPKEKDVMVVLISNLLYAKQL